MNTLEEFLKCRLYYFSLSCATESFMIELNCMKQFRANNLSLQKISFENFHSR